MKTFSALACSLFPGFYFTLSQWSGEAPGTNLWLTGFLLPSLSAYDSWHSWLSACLYLYLWLLSPHIALGFTPRVCVFIHRHNKWLPFLFCSFHSNHCSPHRVISYSRFLHFSWFTPFIISTSSCVSLIFSFTNLLLCPSKCCNWPADGKRAKKREEKKNEGEKQWVRSKERVWQNERKTDSKWDREREKTYFGSID